MRKQSSTIPPVEIQLTRGYVALVDAEDFERVNQYKWHSKVYPLRIYADHSHWNKELKQYQKILLHRFILDAPKGLQVDHIDGNGLNCQRHNLRLCTAAENLRNSRLRSSNKSGYKGVLKHYIAGKWLSRISKDYKSIHIGVFTSPEDAARAYDAKARELFGEFAHLNFPDK